MSIGPPFKSARELVDEELAAWAEYRGRQGHPSRARWADAMTAVQTDDDALDLWRETMATGR